MARLDLTQLKVDTFPTGPGDGAGTQDYTGSTGYCCDTDMDCSSKCRVPTSICELC